MQDRENIVNGSADDLVVAQPDMQLPRQGISQTLELLAVRRELQQRTRLGAAREFGVVDLVPVGATDHEVGVPAEVLIEERRLEHDIDAGSESLGGLGSRCP